MVIGRQKAAAGSLLNISNQRAPHRRCNQTAFWSTASDSADSHTYLAALQYMKKFGEVVFINFKVRLIG